MSFTLVKALGRLAFQPAQTSIYKHSRWVLKKSSNMDKNEHTATFYGGGGDLVNLRDSSKNLID